jgi:hypothetical protein
VWPLLVVLRDPGFRDVTYLLDGVEEVCIKYFLAISPVEALDERILLFMAFAP